MRPAFHLSLSLLLLAASLPLLTLADSPSSSSRRETALTGPYSGPSPSLYEDEDNAASDLLWSDIPAVQLGRGLQPPHRWKEFLPHHPASEEDSVKVVLSRSGEERRKLREVDDGPGTRQQVRRPKTSRSKDRMKEEEGWEDGDEEEDDDDDVDDDQQQSLASARDRKRQKNEQDRQAMGHLKSRAKKEAKNAWKSAKHAAHVVAHPQQAARASNGNDKEDSSSSSSIPLLGAITTLYRLTLSCLIHTYRFFAILTRYALHAVTLAYRSTAYTLRMTWRAWLAVWASGRYVVRQTLRPVRVVMAPVIYIWLGVRFVLWDVPSYYVKVVLREVYPLYVFLGAALALGTCIGLGCALFLWLGSLITRDSSPLENHLDAWREREVGLTLEKQGRLGFEKEAGRVGREWGERERRRRSKAKGKAKEVMGRDTSRRSGARRRAPRAASTGMDSWDETLGSALDSSSSPHDDDDHDTNSNGAGITPSYLRGLGKDWRPLPKGMAHTLAQRVASASSAAESDEGESGEMEEEEEDQGEWSYASGSGHGQGMGSYGSASGSGSYTSIPQRRCSGGSLPAAAAAAWRTPTSRNGGQDEGDDYFSVARGGAPGITRAVPLESPLSYAAAASAGGGDGYVRSASSTPQAHAPLGATGRRNRSRRSGEYAGSAGGTGSASTTPGSTGAPLQSPLLSLSQLAGGAVSSSREQQAALSSPETSTTRNRRGAQGGIVAR